MALNWDELDAALITVLGRLEDGSRLIIHSFAQEEYYVQCALDAGLPLRLEAVGDAVLAPDLQIGADGTAALTGLGWQPPTEAPGNWWLDIPWPGTSAELAAGARLLTATLREVFAVNEASQLFYSAWRDPGAQDLEFATLGIERV